MGFTTAFLVYKAFFFNLSHSWARGSDICNQQLFTKTNPWNTISKKTPRTWKFFVQTKGRKLKNQKCSEDHYDLWNPYWGQMPFTVFLRDEPEIPLVILEGKELCIPTVLMRKPGHRGNLPKVPEQESVRAESWTQADWHGSWLQLWDHDPWPPQPRALHPTFYPPARTC